MCRNSIYLLHVLYIFIFLEKSLLLLHLWMYKKGMGFMTKDKMKQQHEEYMEEERAKLKARIDEIDDEFCLYLLESFLDGLLDNENC